MVRMKSSSALLAADLQALLRAITEEEARKHQLKFNWHLRV